MHVAIIGAYGSAGAAVADRLTPAVGGRVDELTLIDDGDPGGGLCILDGCMPSKEVLSAAAGRATVRSDGRLRGDPPELDLGRIVEKKDDDTLGWAAHRRAAVDALADREGVEFLDATARFVDDRVLEVGDRLIEPDYVVIATGSVPSVPDLPGLDDVGFATSGDVLDARSLPDSGVVMGFGYVGVELVPYLAEAGVDLTVIEHDARPLDEADPAFGDALLDLYREEFGVEIRTGVSEESVEPAGEDEDDSEGEGDGEGVRLHLDDGSAVEAEELFLFTGRTPNLDGLRLDRTSLEPGPGWVDATMRAAGDDRVYVAGDANGREPILHVAKEQGFQTAANLLAADRGDPIEPYTNVHHHVIFAGAGRYPFARVGHTPRSATEAGHATVTATRRAADDGVFETKHAARGLARLVVDATDGTVLGWQALHLHADVMAKTLQVAVELGLDVRDVPDRSYHPTTPEILDGLIRECAAGVADG